MFNKLYIWVTEVRGVTGMEYSLIAGVVGLSVMAASMAVGDDIMNLFGEEGMGGFLSDRIADTDTGSDL